MQNTPTGKHPSRSATKSPSWIAERDALRLFGDRKTRAILALFHARRSARAEEFFVPPHIAKLNNLSPGDLNWALDKLEGKLVVTRGSKRGKWRMLRLLPELEEAFTKPAPQEARRDGGAGKLSSDEERVVFDKADILRRAASSNDESLPVFRHLLEIPPKHTAEPPYPDRDHPKAPTR